MTFLATGFAHLLAAAHAATAPLLGDAGWLVALLVVAGGLQLALRPLLLRQAAAQQALPRVQQAITAARSAHVQRLAATRAPTSEAAHAAKVASARQLAADLKAANATHQFRQRDLLLPAAAQLLAGWVAFRALGAANLNHPAAGSGPGHVLAGLRAAHPGGVALGGCAPTPATVLHAAGADPAATVTIALLLVGASLAATLLTLLRQPQSAGSTRARTANRALAAGIAVLVAAVSWRLPVSMLVFFVASGAAQLLVNRGPRRR